MNNVSSKKKMTLDRLAEIVENGFARVDRKFDSADARFENIDARFERIDSRFVAIEKKFVDRFDEFAMMMARGFLSLQTDMDLKFARVDDSLKNIRRDMLAIHDTWKDHELRITALEKNA